jgi:Na+/H+-dicarboxylate symporter
LTFQFDQCNEDVIYGFCAICAFVISIWKLIFELFDTYIHFHSSASKWAATPAIMLGANNPAGAAGSSFLTASLFNTSSSTAFPFQPSAFNFQEMGMLGWFLVDLAINVAGWAAAATLKVHCD